MERNGYTIRDEGGSYSVSDGVISSYYATLEEAIEMADAFHEMNENKEDGIFLPIKRYIIISKEIMAIVETFDTMNEVNAWLAEDREAVAGSGTKAEYKIIDIEA